MNMRTSVFFSTLFVASALSVTLAQTNPCLLYTSDAADE